MVLEYGIYDMEGNVGDNLPKPSTAYNLQTYTDMSHQPAACIIDYGV